MPKWLWNWGECSDLPVAPAEGGLLRRAGILILLGYRSLISPFFPPSCRFYPSCSAYAVEAIDRHGIARGMVLTAKRLLRCQPLNPGGYDPVREVECPGKFGGVLGFDEE